MLHTGALLSHVLGSWATLGATNPLSWGPNRTWLHQQAGHLPSVTWGDAVSTSAQVAVSFSLSLELLSYQKLPADQMLPGVDIRQSEHGLKQMEFTQNLRLCFTNQTVQACPSLPLHLHPHPFLGGK